MNYQNAIEFLYDSRMMGTKLGLNNINYLLQALGNPHLDFPCVHIAGTNGKGSVSAMLSSILAAAGYKTGLFTSPHLSSFRERIRIGREYIPQQSVADILERIVAVGETMRALEHVTFPTFFEIVTAMAIEYFAESGIDIAIVETGMGGRLDATSAVVAVVSVITNIGMEHAAYLGDTLKKIALEKAGIIKKNVPVITAETNTEALEVIESAARKKNAPLIKIGCEISFSDVKLSANTLEKPFQTLTVQTPKLTYPHLRMPLIGRHQAQNCCIAVGVVELLRENNITVSDDALKLGLAETDWPGRFEVAGNDPVVILDAACNPAAVEALAATLALFIPEGEKAVFVLGFLQDKDYSTMCRKLIPLSAEIILTKPNNSRAADPEQVRQAIKADFDENKLHVVQHLPGAIDKAYTICRSGFRFVCVTGSNYLLGEARQKLGIAELMADFMLSDNL